MITAKQAKEKTITKGDALNKLIENDKEYVEQRIKAGAALGLNKVDAIFSNREVRDAIFLELKSLGYEVNASGILTLEIEW